MNTLTHKRLGLLAIGCVMAVGASATDITDSLKAVDKSTGTRPSTAQPATKQVKNRSMALHGNFQFDAIAVENDPAIGLKLTDEQERNRFRFNTYGDLHFISRYVDAGVRIEYMKFPLPGYEPEFKGWGVPHIYAKGKYKGLELTAGDFYEQFGAGFILRTYEDRPLGVDNSIRGGRLKVNVVNGLRLTALGGLQRRYWRWDKHSILYGGNAEYDITANARGIRDKGYTWIAGASYVLRHEQDQDVMVPNTDYRLNLPLNVSAWDIRTHLGRNAWSVDGEFAWKGQDPSYDNHYTYGTGTALMLGGTYARRGLSAMLQVKRSENMSFRTQRQVSGLSAMVNNMPAFAYQHTYALASMYPYATQSTAGEWAFQGAFAYTFSRHTLFGGKYGTKVKVNLSYIRGLDNGGLEAFKSAPMGSDGPGASFFGMGPEYYHDFNIQLEKRLTKDFNLAFMYMNQSNFDVTNATSGFHGKVRSNIFVLDGKYKFDKRFTLRAELQYLTTHQDDKDWAFGLLELSIAPYLMVSVSDQWNCGRTGDHYYMAGVAGNYRGNRLQLSYGLTREGFNCSGGLCRWVPATKGFRIAYTYNF